MSTKFSTRCTALGAIFLALGTCGTAFGGEEMSAGISVLRGTGVRLQQQQETQKIVVAPPPPPACPDGYFYSLLGGYCYHFTDPTAAR